MKVAFALPGNSFSSMFFINWNNFMFWMKDHDITPIISTAGGSNVVQVRERCLRPMKHGSKRPREPFFGEIEYDYIMWIDSDIMFTPKDFESLVKRDVDIVSGIYKMDSDRYAGMPKIEPQEESSRYFTDSDFRGSDLIEAYWVGMGFMLVKKGVFEKIEPPWFLSTIMDCAWKKDSLVSEDIFFCLRAAESGFKIWADPKVRVGHQKLGIL